MRMPSFAVCRCGGGGGRCCVALHHLSTSALLGTAPGVSVRGVAAGFGGAHGGRGREVGRVDSGGGCDEQHSLRDGLLARGPADHDSEDRPEPTRAVRLGAEEEIECSGAAAQLRADIRAIKLCVSRLEASLGPRCERWGVIGPSALTAWMRACDAGALRRIMVFNRYGVKKGSMLQFSARKASVVLVQGCLEMVRGVSHLFSQPVQPGIEGLVARHGRPMLACKGQLAG